MAIVQLGGCTGSTVAEIGSRADEVECLDRFVAVLGETRSQSLNDSRDEDPVLDLCCQAEERDWLVGVALFSRISRFHCWDDDGVLPNCRHVNSSN